MRASFVVLSMRDQNLVGNVRAGGRQKPLVQDSEPGQPSVPAAVLSNKQMGSVRKLAGASQEPVTICTGN